MGSVQKYVSSNSKINISKSTNVSVTNIEALGQRNVNIDNYEEYISNPNNIEKDTTVPTNQSNIQNSSDASSVNISNSNPTNNDNSYLSDLASFYAKTDLASNSNNQIPGGYNSIPNSFQTAKNIYDSNSHELTDPDRSPVVVCGAAFAKGIAAVVESIADVYMTINYSGNVALLSTAGDFLFGTNDAEKNLTVFQNNLAFNQTDYYYDQFFENTDFGKKLNDSSFIKYNGEIAGAVTTLSKSVLEMAGILFAGAVGGPAASAAVAGVLTVGNSMSSDYKKLSNNGNNMLSLQEIGQIQQKAIGKGVFAAGVVYFGGVEAPLWNVSPGFAAAAGGRNGFALWLSGPVVDSFYNGGDLQTAIDANGGPFAALSFTALGGLVALTNFYYSQQVKINEANVKSTVDEVGFDFTTEEVAPISAEEQSKMIDINFIKTLDGSIERFLRVYAKKKDFQNTVIDYLEQLLHLLTGIKALEVG